MSFTTSRSPDDPYDFKYMQDGDNRGPSPNTAALMAPVGSMTPAYVSKTRDGKPRIIDLNTLGLQKGASSQKQSATGQEGGDVDRGGGYPTGQVNMPHGKPGKDVLTALQKGILASPQALIWKQEQRQRLENAKSRLHQTYVSEARGSFLPTNPPDPDPMCQYRNMDVASVSSARPKEPVSPTTPPDWKQTMAARARQARARIQQEYVDELRQEANYMNQLRPRTLKLGEDRRQQELERVRREVVQPDDDFPTRHATQSSPCDGSTWDQQTPCDTGVPSWPQPDLCDVPSSTHPITGDGSSWTRSNICDTHTAYQPQTQQSPRHQVNDSSMNIQAQVPLTEAELDEKRRQLLVKKKSKSNKESKSKKKSKGSNRRATEKHRHESIVSDAENSTLIQSMRQGESNEIVPPTREQNVPHPPRRNVPHQPLQDEESLGLSNQPMAPVKNKDNESYYSKSNRRLVTKDVDGSPSKSQLIPRQTSKQTMCWNSEIAKRGLGFKSRQTRKAEQEANSSNAEVIKLSTEASNRWKKTTLC